MPGKPYRYEFLDGLRGVAALAVVIKHFSDVFGLGLVINGGLAVDFFFILSGFVVALAYKGRLAEGELRSYAWARFARLYPLVALGSVLGLLAVLAALRVHLGPIHTPSSAIFISFAATLALIPSVFPGGGSGMIFPLNVPLWSMSAEALANIAYGCMFHLINRVQVLLFIISVAGASCLAHFLGARFSNVGAVDSYGFAIARVAYGFFLGVLIEAHRPRLQLPGWLCLALLVAVLSAPWTEGVAAAVIWAVTPPLIVCAAINTRPSAAWAARLCGWGGSLSYPLYATHYPFVPLFSTLARRLAPLHVSPYAVLPLFVASVLLVAWLAERYFDRPARSLLMRLADRREERTPAASLP